MMLKTALLVVAFVCFLFAALAPPTKVNALALGLAAWVLTLLL